MARQRRRRMMAEINVVPYIDVMLVLLIIFMVAAPMLTQGVQVELPEAVAEPIQTPDELEPLVVSIKADGSYYLELGASPQQPVQLAEIRDKVSKIMRQQPKTPVLIRGDRAVDYGAVVQLMAELQSAGATSVGLISQTPQES